MNDEEFARRAFTAAFRSGSTGEPPTLPDVELLALNGRRANRYRHGAYAAGTTVLAGVAVVGVVGGPALLGLGSNSPSGISTGASGSVTPPASPAPSSSSSAPDPAKPSPGVPCATSEAVDWLSIVASALPKGVTATADHAANCVRTPDGSRTFEALFKLSTGTVELQINVQTGPDIASKAGAAAGMIGVAAPTDSSSQSLDPAALASLQADKIAHGAAAVMSSASADGSPSASASLDAAAIASLEAQKQAMVNAQASASPAPGEADANGTKPASDQTCSAVGPDANACVSHLTKGSLSVVDVQLLRTGHTPVVVDVAASNGKDLSVPESGQLPSDATMLALAQAVAAHF